MSDRCWFARHRLVVAVVLLLVGLGRPDAASAQRVTTAGATIDVVGGLDETSRTTFPGVSPKAEPFYSVNPAISITSQGPRSVITGGYAFGWNRVQADLPADSRSHSGAFELSTRLNSQWSLSLTDSVSYSSDLQSFYALRGVELLEDDIVFLFSPVSTRQSVLTNRAGASFNNQMSERSSLAFGISHTIGDYRDVNASDFTDQQTISGTLSFSRRLSERTSLSLSYEGSYFDFQTYNDAMANSVIVGLTTTVARDTNLALSAGPSNLRGSGAGGSNTSFRASAALSKRIKGNTFHFSVSQDNASSSGLGSISKSRRASAGVSRNFGRYISVFGDVSGFDSSGLLDNGFNTRGLTSSANIGFLLTRTLSLHGGAQYQRYTEPAPYAFTQKRYFASLRYILPNLLR